MNLLFATCLVAVTAAAHADTIINLNATNPSQNSGYGITNTLAPTFYYTTTLQAGTYTISAINGVYSGWNYAGTTNPNGPAPNTSEETVGFSTSGTDTFTQSGGQYSYTKAASDINLFTGAFAGNAAALAAAQPYTFTLASATAVSFYIPDDSYNPGNNAFGFDDNTGGVSLDVHAVTPEPSSLILLGTGAMGLAGAVRRRFVK